MTDSPARDFDPRASSEEHVAHAANQRGILLVMNEVAPAADVEFNRWYEQEMIPTRLTRDGFSSARRYRAIAERSSYMTVYACHSIEAAAFSRNDNAGYAERVDAARVHMRSNFRNVQLAACRETWVQGQSSDGNVMVVQCSAQKGREKEARRFISGPVSDSLNSADKLVRIALWEADAGVTANFVVGSRDHLRNYPHWILFLDSPDVATSALMLHSQQFARDAAQGGVLIGAIMRYELLSVHEA